MTVGPNEGSIKHPLKGGTESGAKSELLKRMFTIL